MTIQTLTEDFADGTYSFRMGYDQWLELQAKLDSGPLEVLQRLMNRTWRVSDIRETVRLGLIGGGTSAPDALRLVRSYVEQRPILECVPLAMRIIEIGLYTPPRDDAPGEAPAAAPIGESTPPLSTETRQ